jgi:hypothetical protein
MHNRGYQARCQQGDCPSPIGGKATDPLRGAADRGEYYQAAGAIALGSTTRIAVNIAPDFAAKIVNRVQLSAPVAQVTRLAAAIGQ